VCADLILKSTNRRAMAPSTALPPHIGRREKDSPLVYVLGEGMAMPSRLAAPWMRGTKMLLR
jgi:hypothetical protein